MTLKICAKDPAATQKCNYFSSGRDRTHTTGRLQQSAVRPAENPVWIFLLGWANSSA